MSIVKEKILFSGLDMNLSFAISSKDNLIGNQQGIDSLVDATKIDLINPVVDAEVCRFKYDSTLQSSNLKFYFYNSAYFYNPSYAYMNLFQTVGFTAYEINNKSTRLLNSFFIMEMYDSYNPYTQSKILTNYVSKVLSGEYNDSGTYKTPYYIIGENNKNQFYYLQIPQSFINAQTGNTVNAYVKFMFYNAINGSVNVFYNKSNEGLNTPEKMYFKITLNLSNNTWKFVNTPNTNAHELSSIHTASPYVKRIENTVKNVNNIKQNYPTGSTFQRVTGSYTAE